MINNRVGKEGKYSRVLIYSANIPKLTTSYIQVTFDYIFAAHLTIYMGIQFATIFVTLLTMYKFDHRFV